MNTQAYVKRAIKCGPTGRQPIRGLILETLKREGWMSLRDLEHSTGIETKHLHSVLAEFELEGLVLGLGLPSSNRSSSLFFHLMTDETRALESDGWPIIGIEALPWSLELEFMPKLAEYCQRENLPTFKKHMAAKFSLDSRLSSAGLCEYRPRPKEGFYYRCSWRIHLDSQLFTNVIEAEPGEVSLFVAFLGVLPPSLCNALKSIYSLEEPTAFRRLEHDCLVTITQNRASILLNKLVYGRARICELPLLEADMTKNKILESTKERLNKIAAISPLAHPFIPIGQSEFSLLTGTADRSESL